MLMEPALYVMLGECYDRIGADDDCEFCYKESIKLHPAYRDAYIRLAQKYAYSNRPSECFELLNEMETKTVHVSDWRNVDYIWRPWKVCQIRGDALMWMGKYKEAAIEMYNALSDLKSEDDKREATMEGLFEDINFLDKIMKRRGPI